MLKLFPKLINDIYVSDEYYGESVQEQIRNLCTTATPEISTDFR
jgi:hypothetical protein